MATVVPIDAAVQEAHDWLAELMAEGQFYDESEACGVLSAVMHCLRDRLPRVVMVDLGARLPLLIRGIYFEGWSPERGPSPMPSPKEFLTCVESRLDRLCIDPVSAVCTVFTVLGRRLDSGQGRDIRIDLPANILALWPKRGPGNIASSLLTPP